MKRPIVVVTGSRQWVDYAKVSETLDELNPLIVFAGAATGADKHAYLWCKKTGITMVEVPALWEAQGKKAGPIRNERMLSLAVAAAFGLDTEVIVAAFPTKDSVGTVHCMTHAESLGLRVDNKGFNG